MFSKLKSKLILQNSRRKINFQSCPIRYTSTIRCPISTTKIIWNSTYHITFLISFFALVQSAIPRGVVCPDEMRIGWLDTPPYLTFAKDQDATKNHQPSSSSNDKTGTRDLPVCSSFQSSKQTTIFLTLDVMFLSRINYILSLLKNSRQNIDNE